MTKKSLNILVYLFLLLAFLGFTDATYLTVEHYRQSAPSCHIISGCANVLFSSYSTVAGVPVALGGVFYYLSVLILTVAYLDKRKEKLLLLAAKLTPLGFLASVYFVYLQAFAIKYFCQYCLLSAFTSTVLFILGIVVLFNRSKNTNEKKSDEQTQQELS